MLIRSLTFSFVTSKAAALSLTTKSAALKPLILLDVDGVISGSNGGNKAYWKDVKHKTFDGYSIYYSPTVITKINQWSQVAEIRWLTSWDEKARTMIAPALGINEFELARDPALDLRKDQAAFNCIQMTPSRPLIWIDKLVLYYTENPKAPVPASFWKSRDRTLLIASSEGAGLTPYHLEKIDAFLADTPREVDNFSACELFVNSMPINMYTYELSY